MKITSKLDFQVQWVIRPQSDKFHDFRGFAGRVAGGVFRPGDDITVLPSGFSSRVKEVFKDGEEMEEAFAPQSITITLEDEIDISRGDMLVKANNPAQAKSESGSDDLLVFKSEFKSACKAYHSSHDEGD
jgi:sulfate adenylyltransferase subunit 1